MRIQFLFSLSSSFIPVLLNVDSIWRLKIKWMRKFWQISEDIYHVFGKRMYLFGRLAPSGEKTISPPSSFVRRLFASVYILTCIFHEYGHILGQILRTAIQLAKGRDAFLSHLFSRSWQIWMQRNVLIYPRLFCFILGLKKQKKKKKRRKQNPTLHNLCIS